MEEDSGWMNVCNHRQMDSRLDGHRWMEERRDGRTMNGVVLGGWLAI